MNEELCGAGFSYQQAATWLFRRAITVYFSLEEIEMLDDKEAVSRLCSLKGVGRWMNISFLRGLVSDETFLATMLAPGIICDTG